MHSCIDCGFLARVYWSEEYVEEVQDFLSVRRNQAVSLDLRRSSGWEPGCDINAWALYDIHRALKSGGHADPLDLVVKFDRNCPFFMKFQPGLTFQAHAELRQNDRVVRVGVFSAAFGAGITLAATLIEKLL